MARRIGVLAAAVALTAALGACAGDGTGLDDFGSPEDGSGPLRPTYASIQKSIFGPVCTACHIGSAAPLGLALDANSAYDKLVNVQSVQRTAFRRVLPGKPDSSYLVLKVEGRSGIGGQRMPLGQPPLSAEQIKTIRDWIAAGAQR
jgi:mono/diheme cytochrome c family protein